MKSTATPFSKIAGEPPESPDRNPLAFKIQGMCCAEEMAILKRAVGPVVGGEDQLAFDLLNSRMTVYARSEAVTASTIQQAVARTGMKANLWEAQTATVERISFWQQKGHTILTTASGLFTVAGLVVHAWMADSLLEALTCGDVGETLPIPLVVRALYVVAIGTGAWYVAPKAWHAVRRLRPDMNLLMTLAVIGAVGIGEWFEAATVALLFALSLTLESWSVGRARHAIAAVMNLVPPMARLLHEDGREEETLPDRVPVGSHVLVKPGERLPLDGCVVKGKSDVNQAPITGESMPVPKTVGADVFAGTINGDGALEIECTKPAADTTLARIIRMVGEAQSKRAPSEQWVERFARVYTPAILGFAVLVFLIPPLAFGGLWADWFYRALVLLVIGCPCALVISTPVSIVAALAASARNGVLVKGGVFMEIPARLQAIAFDKTGTLTEGRPTVVRIVPFNNHTETELIERAAAMEARSDHPLAHAIVAYAREHAIAVHPAEDFQVIQGKGASGLFKGTRYWLGSHRYLEERGQETADIHNRLTELSQAQQTVIVIGNDAHVCGLIAVADAIRKDAAATIQALHQNGLRPLVLLTGDNQGTARAIAQTAGMDEVHAELLPEDKVTVMEALVARYGCVAMVGDGVNDAPAMGRASLGIAMGAAGSDTAIETADIALMSDDLSRIPWLIRHARRTLTVIRQNIVFALAIKALFMVLTFLGYASLWAAIAADMGASFIVILNSLRLLSVPSTYDPDG